MTYPTGLRKCSYCKEIKKLEEFVKNKGKRLGYAYECKLCHTSVKWEKGYGYRKFAMSLEDYQDMYNAQKGKCAICKKEVPERKLVVDHDHETGKVRELLCSSCNITLGTVEKKNLKAYMEYLEKHR